MSEIDWTSFILKGYKYHDFEMRITHQNPPSIKLY